MRDELYSAICWSSEKKNICTDLLWGYFYSLPAGLTKVIAIMGTNSELFLVIDFYSCIWYKKGSHLNFKHLIEKFLLILKLLWCSFYLKSISGWKYVKKRQKTKNIIVIESRLSEIISRVGHLKNKTLIRRIYSAT